VLVTKATCSFLQQIHKGPKVCYLKTFSHINKYVRIYACLILILSLLHILYLSQQLQIHAGKCKFSCKFHI